MKMQELKEAIAAKGYFVSDRGTAWQLYRRMEHAKPTLVGTRTNEKQFIAFAKRVCKV